MRIIPVIDVKAGHVVHAVGGRREQYRPIRSRLVASSRPEDVARAFRDRVGLPDLYVADLDAIAGREPAWDLYRTLAGMNLNLMVDAGVRDVATARAVQTCGVSSVVVGLETVSGPPLVGAIVDQLGTHAVWFSLDLRNGEPIGNLHDWPGCTPESIAAEAVRSGVSRLIVVDVGRVGERAGLCTEDLCRKLLQHHPGLELIAGGGIRDESDVQMLQRIGVAGALVATALHDGRLFPQERDS